MKKKLGVFFLMVFIIGTVILAGNIIPKNQIPKVVDIGPHQNAYVPGFYTVDIPKTEATISCDYYFELYNFDTKETIQSIMIPPGNGETTPRYTVSGILEGKYAVQDRHLVSIYSSTPVTITVTMDNFTSVFIMFRDVFLYIFILSIGSVLINKIFDLKIQN